MANPARSLEFYGGKPTDHDDGLIHDLAAHPGFPVMVKRVEAELARQSGALATKILTSLEPVDQREVDERRGFRKGAAWFLREAKRNSKQFQQEDGETA